MQEQDSLKQLNEASKLVAGTARKHVGLVIEQSDKDVSKLMSTFQSLLSKLQEDKKAPSVMAEITAILEALQFHDRTNQILLSIQQTLDVYMDTVEKLAQGEKVDLQAVEQELKNHFVVAEQYAEEGKENNTVETSKPIYF